MIEGFYDHTVCGLILRLKNYSLDTYETYEVSNQSLRQIKYFFTASKHMKLIMPFDHYPSLEELQQHPELFI